MTVGSGSGTHFQLVYRCDQGLHQKYLYLWVFTLIGGIISSRTSTTGLYKVKLKQK